jgi:hypothetical protein
MVSRGSQAALADRTNWITDRPNLAVGIGWLVVFLVAVLLTAQTIVYILQNGVVAVRPDLSAGQTVLRVALGAGATAFLFVRRRPIERTGLFMAIVAAGSSALFGFGMRSPLLAAVRVLSHLVLWVLAAIVAWQVLTAMQREAHRLVNS